MVDLVEDDQRGHLGGDGLVVPRPHRYAGVGDRHPVELPGPAPSVASASRVELDADLGGGIGPLGFEVLGRHDHDHPTDNLVSQQFGGHPQGEGGLAGAWGGHRQEVPGRPLPVQRERFGLPGPQQRRRTPRRALREGGGEPFEGGLAQGCTAPMDAAAGTGEGMGS